MSKVFPSDAASVRAAASARLVAAVLAVSLMTAVAAAERIVIAHEPHDPRIGEDVVVTIALADAHAFATWGLTLHFDPRHWVLTRQEAGLALPFLPDMRMPEVITRSGEVRCGGFSPITQTAEAGDVLARFTFQATVAGTLELRVDPSGSRSADGFTSVFFTEQGVARHPLGVVHTVVVTGDPAREPAPAAEDHDHGEGHHGQTLAEIHAATCPCGGNHPPELHAGEDGTAKLADLTGDGRVDAVDLVPIARAFESDASAATWSPEADRTGDGRVDADDLHLVMRYFGHTW